MPAKKAKHRKTYITKALAIASLSLIAGAIVFVVISQDAPNPEPCRYDPEAYCNARGNLFSGKTKVENGEDKYSIITFKNGKESHIDNYINGKLSHAYDTGKYDDALNVRSFYPNGKLRYSTRESDDFYSVEELFDEKGNLVWQSFSAKSDVGRLVKEIFYRTNMGIVVADSVPNKDLYDLNDKELYTLKDSESKKTKKDGNVTFGWWEAERLSGTLEIYDETGKLWKKVELKDGLPSIKTDYEQIWGEEFLGKSWDSSSLITYKFTNGVISSRDQQILNGSLTVNNREAPCWDRQILQYFNEGRDVKTLNYREGKLLWVGCDDTEVYDFVPNEKKGGCFTKWDSSKVKPSTSIPKCKYEK